MNKSEDKCPICGSHELSAILGNYMLCGNCKTAWKTTMTGLIPASTKENNELVFQHSKTRLFCDALDTIFKLVGKRGRVLDIGCGHGYFLKLARDSGWETAGIEIAKKHADYGRNTFGLNIYSKPLTEMKFQDDFFDAVMLWSVIDVLPDPLAELKEIYRVLKPGGALYVRVNNFTFHYPGVVLGKTKIFQMLHIAPGIVLKWGITKKTLETLFKSTDFVNTRIYNSKMTSGDPYGTGGSMGGFLVDLMKHIYYIFSQVLYVFSFGSLAISSSLLATARKPDNAIKNI